MSHSSLRRALTLFIGCCCLVAIAAGCQSQPDADNSTDAEYLLQERADQPMQAEGEAAEPEMAAEDQGEGAGESEEAAKVAAFDPAEQAEDGESAVLLRPMGQLLAEAIIARREAGKPLPEDYKSSGFVVSVIESLRLQHPDLFRVTEQEKQRFEAGEFDDEANLRRVRQALAEIERRDLSTTTLSNYLVQQFHAGELEGVRLELAARLLEARVGTALGDGS